MELQGYVTKNFKARTEFIVDSQKVIEEALLNLPADGQVKIVIVDQGTSFLISVVAAINGKIFSSESHHPKKKTWGLPRNWQVGALALVFKDLLHQINKRLRRGPFKHSGEEVLKLEIPPTPPIEELEGSE